MPLDKSFEDLIITLDTGKTGIRGEGIMQAGVAGKILEVAATFDVADQKKIVTLYNRADDKNLRGFEKAFAALQKSGFEERLGRTTIDKVQQNAELLLGLVNPEAARALREREKAGTPNSAPTPAPEQPATPATILASPDFSMLGTNPLENILQGLSRQFNVTATANLLPEAPAKEPAKPTAVELAVANVQVKAKTARKLSDVELKNESAKFGAMAQKNPASTEKSLLMLASFLRVNDKIKPDEIEKAQEPFNNPDTSFPPNQNNTIQRNNATQLVVMKALDKFRKDNNIKGEAGIGPKTYAAMVKKGFDFAAFETLAEATLTERNTPRDTPKKPAVDAAIKTSMQQFRDPNYNPQTPDGYNTLATAGNAISPTKPGTSQGV